MNPQTSRAKSPAVPIKPRTRVRTLPASQSCIDVIDTPEARTFRPATARSAALPPGPPCASGRLADDKPEGFTPSSRATSVSQGGLTVKWSCRPLRSVGFVTYQRLMASDRGCTATQPSSAGPGLRRDLLSLQCGERRRARRVSRLRSRERSPRAGEVPRTAGQRRRHRWSTMPQACPLRIRHQ